MRIKPCDTAFIVVDYQEKLVPIMFEKEKLIKNSKILIEGLKAHEIPFVVTEQYKKGLGETIYDIKESIGEFEAFDKTTFGCYDDENIKNKIDSFKRKNIIVFGIEAHICVLQTVIALRQEGYNVILVEDCISSRKALDKACALKRAEYEGAVITTYESLLFELTLTAKSPVFKKISALIK